MELFSGKSKDYYYLIKDYNKVGNLKLNPKNNKWMYVWYGEHSNQFLHVHRKYRTAFIFDLFFNDQYKQIKTNKLEYIEEIYLKEGKIDEY